MGAGLLVTIFRAFLVLAGLFSSSFGATFVGAFFLLVAAPLMYAGVRQGTMGFNLISFRLVRAKRGTILNQISRQVFRAKNFALFLRISRYTPSNARDRRYEKARQKVETFHVEVLDPNSGNVLMSLGWVPLPSRH